jgi:hypothetical protein
MRFPLPQQKWIINRKNVARREKNVDKIGPFQIDEEGLPAKLLGLRKRKWGRCDPLSSPTRMMTKGARKEPDAQND